jgi:hypothetical protein
MHMKAATILTLMFFAMGAASQDVAQSPTQVQCRFSDGSTITVRESHQHQRYRLSTDATLLATKGTSVPAGDYAVYPEKDSHGHWTLKIMKPIRETYLFVLSFPMSITTSSSPN